MSAPNNDTPRAWIACLACYNAGRLVGDWFEGTDLPTEVGGDDGFDARMGADLPADHSAGVLDGMHEELWVLDHEGYGPLLRGECSPTEAQRLAELLEGVDDPDALGAFVDHYGKVPDTEALLEAFEEAYAGEWDSERAYAEELVDDLGMLRDVSEDLARYFDYEAYARDLFMGDVYSSPAPGGGIYVFRRI